MTASDLLLLMRTNCWVNNANDIGSSTDASVILVSLSRIYLIFQTVHVLSLTNTALMVRLCFCLVLLAVIDESDETVFIFCPSLQKLDFLSSLGCVMSAMSCHDDIMCACQMSVSGVSVVAPPMFVWHCVSVGHPAPYLSRSHPPVSGPGVMPSNIVPTAITSELELP